MWYLLGKLSIPDPKLSNLCTLFHINIILASYKHYTFHTTENEVKDSYVIWPRL